MGNNIKQMNEIIKKKWLLLQEQPAYFNPNTVQNTYTDDDMPIFKITIIAPRRQC